MTEDYLKSHVNQALSYVVHAFFIRNHFISNVILESIKFKKLLTLQGKRKETFLASSTSKPLLISTSS